MILRSFWDHFGFVLGSFWIISGSFWIRSGSILGLFWSNSDLGVSLPPRPKLKVRQLLYFDENGRIVQNATNQYPAPEIEGIRDRMFDIRGVDMRITFRSKNPFFTRERRAPREVIGFTPNRSSLNEDHI